MRCQQRRDNLPDLLKLRIGVCLRNRIEGEQDAIERLPRAFECNHRICERGRSRIIGNGRHLCALLRDSGLDGRKIIIIGDPVERRRAERKRAGRQQRVLRRTGRSCADANDERRGGKYGKPRWKTVHSAHFLPGRPEHLHSARAYRRTISKAQGVQPFEFAIAFFSFIYALALTHLLLSITALIRNRRSVIFSLPQVLWMTAALLNLIANWISLWDFHTMASVALSVLLTGFILSMLQYFVCALVSPDPREPDLRKFHDEQSRTYIGVFAMLVIFAVIINAMAGSFLDTAKWAQENAVVLFMVPSTIVPLVIRKQWASIAGALTIVVLSIYYLIAYYPVLK